MKQEVHILLGCADARDLNQVQLDTTREYIKKYREKGIHIEMRVIRIAGSFASFGPYANAGFFYGVKHLNLTDQMVMGYDEEQTERMLKKISKDPIMDLTVKKFGVNLIPITQKALLEKYDKEVEVAEVF